MDINNKSNDKHAQLPVHATGTTAAPPGNRSTSDEPSYARILLGPAALPPPPSSSSNEDTGILATLANGNTRIPSPSHGAANGIRPPFYSDDAGWTRVTRQRTCETAKARDYEILAGMPPLATIDAPSPSALAVQEEAQPATAAARQSRTATAANQRAAYDAAYPALPMPPPHKTPALPPCEHGERGHCATCNGTCRHGVVKWSCHVCANARARTRNSTTLLTGSR